MRRTVSRWVLLTPLFVSLAAYVVMSVSEGSALAEAASWPATLVFPHLLIFVLMWIGGKASMPLVFAAVGGIDALMVAAVWRWVPARVTWRHFALLWGVWLVFSILLGYAFPYMAHAAWDLAH